MFSFIITGLYRKSPNRSQRVESCYICFKFVEEKVMF